MFLSHTFCRKFTRLPHLAGTKQNLLLAEQIKEDWLAFGVDSVELVPYDVLLSYPNQSQPNYISIVDTLLGNEVHTYTGIQTGIHTHTHTQKELIYTYSLS